MGKRNVVEALKDCISLQSQNPPGNVEQVVRWLEKWAESFGAEVKRQEVELLKNNLLISMNFGSGPTLVFNTHMDVNNPLGQEWTTDPFVAEIVGTRLYGVGACDAKGSLVSMMCALESLALNPAGLRGTIMLTAVMGEESGGVGSLHLVSKGLEADGAIVGEPTNLHIAVAHKGTYMKRIRIKGKSAHSAQSEKGINAITHAAHFILKIEQLNQKLLKEAHPFLGSASISVTIIDGGTQQNTIPGQCDIVIDRRLLPGETHEKADKEMDDILKELHHEIGQFEIEFIQPIVATIPSETSVGEKIVEKAIETIKGIVPDKQYPIGFRAGCDMSKLVTVAKIPTIILGPGSLAQAHVADEFVEINELYVAEKLYEDIARNFLS
nr:M20 family metallopeptidase [Sporosarcina psychrophila]